MTTSTSTPSTQAAHAATSALNALRGTPTRRRGIDTGDDAGGFAAQLRQAQPAQAQADSEADGKAARDPAAASADRKPDSGDSGHAAAPEANGAHPSPASSTPAAPAADPAAWSPWTAMAGASAPKATGDESTAASGGAVRGKTLPAGRQLGAAALADRQDPLEAARDKAAAALGRAALHAADPQAAGGEFQPFGAANAATGTADSAAALLPSADPGAFLAPATAALGVSASSIDSASAASAAAPAQATIDLPPQSPAFAPALGQQIEVWVREGIGHAEVQLNPQDLGPIRVRIAVEGQTTRVEMSADVASTRSALEQALPQLSDALGEVGLSLAGGSVSGQAGDSATGQDSSGKAFAAFGDGSGRSGSPRGGAANARSGTQAGDGMGPVGASLPRATLARRGLLDFYA